MASSARKETAPIAVLAIHQLGQRRVDQGVQADQRPDLETLDQHGGVGAVQAATAQGLDDRQDGHHQRKGHQRQRGNLDQLAPKI